MIDEDQLTACAKVVPGELSYCDKREVTAGSFHTITIPNIHFMMSTFDENSSYCVSYLIFEIYKK